MDRGSSEHSMRFLERVRVPRSTRASEWSLQHSESPSERRPARHVPGRTTAIPRLGAWAVDLTYMRPPEKPRTRNSDENHKATSPNTKAAPAMPKYPKSKYA